MEKIKANLKFKICLTTILKEYMHNIKISKSQLAKLSGIPLKRIKALLHLKKRYCGLTQEEANGLEKVFQMPAQSFLNIDNDMLKKDNKKII